MNPNYPDLELVAPVGVGGCRCGRIVLCSLGTDTLGLVGYPQHTGPSWIQAKSRTLVEHRHNFTDPELGAVGPITQSVADSFT
ncbi:MAG: hypothetical protein CM1200mP18_00810 [Gammaproteobacteria bacterium]|nr:MAG: hypothetical protein CM1200mP18_00810 [Gammaproteobacteria bacterium]